MDASGSPPGGGEQAEKTSPAAGLRKKSRTRRLTGSSVPVGGQSGRTISGLTGRPVPMRVVMDSDPNGTDCDDGTDSDGTDSVPTLWCVRCWFWVLNTKFCHPGVFCHRNA